MRFLPLWLVLLVTVPLRAVQPAPDRVEVPAMKTSVYVGTVTLTTGAFVRTGETFESTYEAKVFPWFFWSEHGRIAMHVPAAELARLARGERIAFTGDARNHRDKPRRVTGHAEPAEASSGRIKVRIHLDDLTLVFEGVYRFTPPPA